MLSSLFAEDTSPTQKAFLSLTYLYVFFIPFPHITAIQQILYYVILCLFLYRLINKQIVLSLDFPLVLPLAIFILWSLVTVVTALDKIGSLQAYYSHLIRYVVLLVVFVHTFRSRKHLTFLGYIIMISGAVYATGLILYWYVLLDNSLFSRFSLASVGTNTIGYVTILALVLAIHFLKTESRAPRWLPVVCLSVTGIATLLSQSRASFIALAFVFFIMFHEKKKTLFACIILLFVFIFLSPMRERVFEAGAHYSIRIGSYYYFAEMIKENPWTGLGFSLDTFLSDEYINREVYMSRIPVEYAHPEHPYYWPHNMLINLAVRTGLVGLVLFLAVPVTAIRMCLVSVRNQDEFVRSWAVLCLAALSSFLVKGMFDQVFLHLADMIFYTILSMIVFVWREGRKAVNR